MGIECGELSYHQYDRSALNQIASEALVYNPAGGVGIQSRKDLTKDRLLLQRVTDIYLHHQVEEYLLANTQHEQV